MNMNFLIPVEKKGQIIIWAAQAFFMTLEILGNKKGPVVPFYGKSMSHYLERLIRKLPFVLANYSD